MQFVDEVTIETIAGNGGNGCMAFRREKFLPLGGPSGGDGGRGGSVILEAQSRLGTLLDLRYQRIVKAKRGEHGRGRDQYGKGADDVVVPVPIGTQVFDADEGTLLGDLTVEGANLVVAKGGAGGQGNIHFATPTDRAPRRADPGEAGGKRRLRLELKLLADVGVVGFPNAGKSTFISAVSRAKPKIADYPFTTLTPNLGVTSIDGGSFVIADIPGIIEGAAEGAGLGIRFLRHIERTGVLLHVLTVDPDPSRTPIDDFDRLLHELESFDAQLLKRPMVCVLNKSDLPDVRDAETELREALQERGRQLLVMSAVTRQGLEPVLRALAKHVHPQRHE